MPRKPSRGLSCPKPRNFLCTALSRLGVCIWPDRGAWLLYGWYPAKAVGEPRWVTLLVTYASKEAAESAGSVEFGRVEFDLSSLCLGFRAGLSYLFLGLFAKCIGFGFDIVCSTPCREAIGRRNLGADHCSFRCRLWPAEGQLRWEDLVECALGWMDEGHAFCHEFLATNVHSPKDKNLRSPISMSYSM